MATAGSIVIDLLMRTGAFETDSKRAEKRLKELQKSAKQFGVAVGGAVLTAGAALTTVTVQAINFADQIDEMSQRLGVSTEQLSGWAYAAKLSGTNFETLTSAIPKLSKNMAAAQEEGSRLSELFKTLGVATVDAQGNLRDVEDVLPELADRFKALDNDTLEAALAMELFGRSGAEMLEFLNKGSDGIRDLTDRAAELGIVIGSDTAANAAEFKDRLDDLNALASSLGLQISEKLLPTLIELVENLAELTREGDLAAKTGESVEHALRGIGLTGQLAVDGVQALTNAALGLYNTMEGLIRLSPPGWLMSLADGRTAGDAFGDAGAAFGAAKDSGAETRFNLFGTPLPGGSTAPAGPRSPDRRGSGVRGGGKRWADSAAAASSDEGLERRLAGFLEKPTGGTVGGGSKKSEAEMEAERLQQAYDSLSESLARQQFLLGKTGEEAQVRYEIELGSLQELEPALKDQLLAKAALLDAEIAAREEAEKQEELDKRATEAFEQMNGSILEQIELIGMSADEQEIFNNLAWAGVDAESARGQEIIRNTERLQQMREQMQDQIEAMDAVRDAGREFLGDLFDGSKSFKDAFLDALDSIHQRLLQMIADNLIEQLLGKDGDPGGGAAGDWLGNLFGAFFGGAKAGGGDTIAGRGYLVGEEGPELFVPRTAGTVIPAHETAAMGRGGRGGTVVVNNAFNMPGRYDMRTQAQIAADVARIQQKQTARGTA